MAPRRGGRLDLRGQVNRCEGLKMGAEGGQTLAETRVADTPRTKALRPPILFPGSLCLLQIIDAIPARKQATALDEWRVHFKAE